MDAYTLERDILSGFEAPRIADRCVNIADYGARADSAGEQTERIQTAIDEMAAAGGGRVLVPGGRFLTGSLRLKSGVELCLARPDSVLAFTTRADERHYPLAFCHWEGTPCHNYRALLYANGESDIAITGQGTLDGQAGASVWWNWHHQMEKAWSKDGVDLQNHARMALREMNEQGVPVAKRVFGDGAFLRPNFIQLIGCERVLIRGVQIHNSPMWLINPVLCKDVWVDGVSLMSSGPNSDGVDPESCERVLIEGCRFFTGDDCISLKSGRDRDGREQNAPCCGVVIRHNVFADGHGGVALGSEAAGGIEDVVVHHNRFDSPNLTYAFRMKTNAKRGGRMRNLWFCDSDIRRVSGACVHATMLYEDGRQGQFIPSFQDIHIERVCAHGGEYGLYLEAFEESPITGLEVRDVRIDGVTRPLWAANWQGALVENVLLNGRRYPRPANVRILGVPAPGEAVYASADVCAGPTACRFTWLLDGQEIGHDQCLTLPKNSEGARLSLMATAENGEAECSRPYTVLREPPNAGDFSGAKDSVPEARLRCRGLLDGVDASAGGRMTKGMLAEILMGFAPNGGDRQDARQVALENGFLVMEEDGRFGEDVPVTREVMATVAMQACGVSYKNASTTRPVCADVDEISAVHSTNVARALYFGFLTLDDRGRFSPNRALSVEEAMAVLCKVADFAGM